MKSVINLNKDDFQSKTILDISGIAPSICAGEGGNKLKVVYTVEQSRLLVAFDVYNMASTGDKAKTLNSIATDSDHVPVVCYGISSYDSNAMKSSNPHSGIYEATTSRTLDLNGGNPACNQGGMMVVIALEGNGSRPSHAGNGYSESKTMYTLNTIEQHAVCYKSAGFVGRQGAKSGSVAFEMEKAPTLRSGITSDVVYCVLNDQGGAVLNVSDKAGTLRAQEHGHQPIICFKERAGKPGGAKES